MRHRTSIIIIWGGVLVLLWAATFLSVRWIIGAHSRESDDARAHRAMLSMHGAAAQRMQRMREGCRLMMTVPEVRALTGEARGEVSEENIGALTGRLDALRTLVDASCVCVLDGNAAAVAQNSGSPWKSLEELRSFLERSPQASAMIAGVFAAAATAARDQPPPEVWGLWASGSELYHVVGVPLISDDDQGAGSRADGALITAMRVGDDFARAVGRGAGCDVTFIASGQVGASTLSVELRPAIRRLADTSAGGSELEGPFEMGVGDQTFRSVLRPVFDPCSGDAVGAVLIQSDVAGAEWLLRSVTGAFVLLLAAGVASAAIVTRAARAAPVERRERSLTAAPLETRRSVPARPSFTLEMFMSPNQPFPAAPLDYDALVRRCSGNSAVAERVIEKFAAQLGDVVATLRGSLDAGDAGELARTAHALKGTAAMTGAEGVRAFAESLEMLGREGRLDGAGGLIGSLHEQIDTCLAFIQQRRRAAGSAGAPGPSVSKGIAA